MHIVGISFSFYVYKIILNIMKCYTILIGFISIVTISCNKSFCDKNHGHNGLVIGNTSSIIINYEFYWNYPDTVIGSYNPIKNGTNGISPMSSGTRDAGRTSCWEELLKDGRKEWIYFFNRDTILSLNWDIVRQTNRGLLERRLIDLHYLESNDFIVNYP